MNFIRADKRIVSFFKYDKKETLNTLKVCLCVIGKEENLYIKYFLEAYKKLGFNHIFIYDNNNIDGENFEEVIFDDIKKGFVSIINFRGYRRQIRGPQMDAYYDCYKRNNLLYDWIAFFDVDEFLIFNHAANIQDFLKNSIYNECEIIKINWKVFSDNNLMEYEDKSPEERFTEEIKENLEVNTVYKVIIRGNLLNYSSRKIYNPHDIFMSNKSCDSSGKIRLESHIKPPEYKYAILNHYTKTIREYCKKIRKGDVYFNRYLDENLKKYYFNAFFKYSKKTKEKVAIFNKEFNTTLE